MRRSLVAALGLALLVPGALHAQPLNYRGYTVTFDAAVSEAEQRRLERSLRCQIDIVETVALPAPLLGRLRQVPITIEGTIARGPGQFRKGQGVFLMPQSLSDKTPVLLHELLHAYHVEMMPEAQRQRVTAFYQRAKTANLFPAQSYMLTNDREFFAMTASTLLNGRIQRDPYTRVRFKAAMPVYHAWLLEQFGMTEDQLVPAVDRGCA